MFRGGISLKIGLAAMLLTFSAALAWAEEPYSIEPVWISSTALPKTITDDLKPKGVLLFKDANGRKESICEVFWAKVMPAVTAVRPSTDNGYANIRPGALVGVIRLLPEATEDYNVDFYSQKLKPGYYTMRYAVMPAGIGENGPLSGDFVVLSPIAQDRDPGRTLRLDEMVRLGKLTSQGDEAARMQLMRAESSKNPLPGITVDDAGAGTLHFKLRLTRAKGAPAQELELALLVVTPKPDLGGS
jgi:hypothetical protein